MAQFSGVPVTFNRFLGAFSQDDPTNFPAGLACVCRNTDFNSPTSADTRCGFNQTMQGVNKSPITGLLGFVYQPELASETAFQMPLLFDFMGTLQRESPVGSGICKAIPQGLFTPPAQAHLLGCVAGNKVWAAFSNLLTPSGGSMCFNPFTPTLGPDPFGMKPFGWTWAPNTNVIVGEVCTPPSPVTGNGHTYQCVQAGTTGATPPTFPTITNASVNDGTAQWVEKTMVVANALPVPPPATLGLTSGGSFAAGLDVYIVIAYNNAQGISLTSTYAKLTTAASGTAIDVQAPTLAACPAWLQELTSPYAVSGFSVYVASVSTGSYPPPLSGYGLFGTVGFGGTLLVTGAGSTAPSTQNTARVTGGQLPTPVTEPVITRASGSGSFAVGRDVYIRLSYVKQTGAGTGFTPLGPSNVILDTQANDAIQVTVQSVTDYPQITQVGIYEADVPTGTPEPPVSAYSLSAFANVGVTNLVTATANFGPAPTTNTTGTAGNIAPDNPYGGLNGTQGYRYAALMWLNRNETVSGFTLASVQSCIVDEAGWELAAFNILTGPSNIVGRIVAFTVADGTPDGPFNWNGLVNLKVPSQNNVYPMSTLSDGVMETATVLLDNTTTQAIFNFDDTYLLSDNDVTDRLRVGAPPIGTRIDFLKSVNRLAVSGVPGYLSGGVLSLGGDYESFYGDTSPLPTYTDQRVWGYCEYRNVIYQMRERGGDIVTPNQGDPASWDVKERWDDVGPCGPRAFDACGKFLCFANRSGFYRYVDTDVDLMTKEIPREWKYINWNAATTVCVYIDQETHTVRILAPMGQSVVPNEEIVLSYIEGWENPIHFSVYAGAEKAMDACRRFSFNDMAAFVVKRLERTIAPSPQQDGPAYLPQVENSFYLSQLAYGSSAADGTVQARTPGVFSDNGAGIDYQYETASIGQMMAMCKMEGFNLNATGNGEIPISFLAARDMVSDQKQNGPVNPKELKVKRVVTLKPNQQIGITRRIRSRANEFWRVRVTNGKVPGSWISLKWMQVYVIPISGARGELDRA